MRYPLWTPTLPGTRLSSNPPMAAWASPSYASASHALKITCYIRLWILEMEESQIMAHYACGVWRSERWRRNKVLKVKMWRVDTNINIDTLMTQMIIWKSHKSNHMCNTHQTRCQYKKCQCFINHTLLLIVLKFSIINYSQLKQVNWLK